MSLDTPFDPAMDFLMEFPAIKPGETKTTKSQVIRSTFIESSALTDNFATSYTLSGTMQADGSVRVMTILGKRGWERTSP
jgi:hypothetical protein